MSLCACNDNSLLVICIRQHVQQECAECGSIWVQVSLDRRRKGWRQFAFTSSTLARMSRTVRKLRRGTALTCAPWLACARWRAWRYWPGTWRTGWPRPTLTSARYQSWTRLTRLYLHGSKPFVMLFSMSQLQCFLPNEGRPARLPLQVYAYFSKHPWTVVPLNASEPALDMFLVLTGFLATLTLVPALEAASSPGPVVARCAPYLCVRSRSGCPGSRALSACA